MCATCTDDLRSHSRHAELAIKIINLQGNGISSTGAKDFLALLKDASVDTFGSLGHYLGRVTSLDLSNNSRIDNDVGLVLLKMIDVLTGLTKLSLSGCKISSKMRKQIHNKLEERINKNYGVAQAKKRAIQDLEPQKSSNTKVVPVSKSTGTSVARQTMMVSSLKKFHTTWKNNVAYKMNERNSQAFEAKSALEYLHRSGEEGKRGKGTSKFKTKTKWQKYATDGDLQQYSTENAMKRERLRNNPEIIALIDHWWTQVILAKYDKDHDELLNKQGKQELFVF